MFLVNGMTSHDLFDSRATRYFVSLSLSKKLSDAPKALDYMLEIEIADDHTVSALSVHRSCILELFREKYTLDLVPILV